MPPKIDILAMNQDTELLQSFARVGINEEGGKKGFTKKSRRMDSDLNKARFSPEVGLIVKKQKQIYDEMYTDKDRAAAVSIGNIKKSEH
jgi:hypothetical protein